MEEKILNEKAFYQTLQFLNKDQVNNPVQTKKTQRVADKTTSHPHLSEVHFPKAFFQDSRTCCLVLIGATLLGLQTPNLNKIRERAFKVGRYYRWTGTWQTVKTLVLTASERPAEMIELYLSLERLSLRSWFGSEVVKLKRILSLAKTSWPYAPSEHKVKKTQRKRGYDDHGSAAPFDKLGPEHFADPDYVENEDLKERLLFEEILLHENSFYPDGWMVERKQASHGTERSETRPSVLERKSYESNRTSK